MKKVTIGAAVVLASLLGAFWFTTFAGIAQPQDGTVLRGGITQVLDDYVLIHLVPIGDGNFVLIDAGNDPRGEKLLAALAAKGAGVDSVKAIFLTHGHHDHIAGCHLFPQARVYAFPEDVKLAAGEERSKGLFPWVVGTPVAKRAKVTQKLTDGQAVTVGLVTITAYAVPGHTAGSGAYLVEGVLFLGDTALLRTNGSLKGAQWLFADNPDQNIASLQRLYTRLKAEHAEVKTLAFPHSKPVEDFELLRTASR